MFLWFRFLEPQIGQKLPARLPLEKTSDALHHKFLNILVDFGTISIPNLGIGYTMEIMPSSERSEV
jgi:hypothetical protein